MGSAGSSGSASGSSASGSAGSAGSSGAYGGANDGMPDIPTGTGTGAGDLDEIFNKSLGDFDGEIDTERGEIAGAGGGSAKAAGQRERGDASAVANGTMGEMGAAGGDGGMADAGMGGMGAGGAMDGGTGGMSGQQGTASGPGSGGMGGEGIAGSDAAGEQGDAESADDAAQAVKIPDDIPVDGSGDDLVGRQIREAAIAMQETNPEAAEKLWDEYRKHTGIK